MDSELWALWATAAGTFAAAVSAVGIALWQNRAQGQVERGKRHERASLVLIEAADHQSVTIANLSSTPVWNLYITTVESMLWEEGGVVGLASAGPKPSRFEVVTPNERKTFTMATWRDNYHGAALPPPHSREGEPRWGSVDVTFVYTDAFKTTWRREGHSPPRTTGGSPLPGEVTARHRLWGWLKKSSKTAAKNLTSGVRGKGFRRKTQLAKQRERSRQRLAARKAARKDNQQGGG
ncbi:hypothetical protein ACH419_30605 [Streptomyces bobili]|uniref:hypothetical protein n=1 Tax=Streptomyces bobili TaxID=67280 RepID=UPI00379CB16B